MIVRNIVSFSQYEIYKHLRKNLAVLEFLNGLLASQHFTFYFLYTNKYNVSLLTYSIIEVIVSCLFCINPLMGYLADTYPLFGYKRKSYLILTGIIGSLGYFLCAMTNYFNISVLLAFIFHFCIDFSISFRIVLMDSLCVIMNNYKKQAFMTTRANESTKSVAIVFASRLLGKILSHSVFGFFYKYLNEKCIVIRFLHTVLHCVFNCDC